MQSASLAAGRRVVRWYSAGDPGAPLTVFWHHGTPNSGEPPAPLQRAADARGIRFIGMDRPGYGGTTRMRRRSVADVVADVERVADAAGAERFAVLGHSGGGPHALACAALLPDRVLAAATVASLAPLSGLKQRWWRGMHPAGLAELRAAVKGGAALRAVLERGADEPGIFTQRDHEALRGDWAWFNQVVAGGTAHGLDGMVLDDLAFVTPWGFRVAEIRVRTLVVQGTEDRIVPVQHGRWLAAEIQGATYWERGGEGHISVMRAGVDVLDWLERHGPAPRRRTGLGATLARWLRRG